MAYKIKFDYNGGDSHVDTLNTVTGQGGAKYSEFTFSNEEKINFGDAIPLPTANQVEKDDNVLIGWSPSRYVNGIPQDNNNKKIYVKEYTVSKMVNNTLGAALTDETLYAVWKSLNPLKDAVSIIPQMSRTTETTQAPVDISNLLKNGTSSQKELANTAMGILDRKQQEKVIANKPCYVTFTIPEWGESPNVHDPVKAVIQVGYINDINQWKLSEAKNTPEYEEKILSEYPESSDTPGATAYTIIWARKGVEINDTTVLSDGDILIGKPIEISDISKYVTAIPMVYNETYMTGVKVHDYNKGINPQGEWVKDSKWAYTVNDRNGYAATNYGYVTITVGGRQITTLNTNDFNYAKLNATYGDRVTLMATPRNNSTFMGWYRRESENNYTILEGVDLYDSNGNLIDSGDIKDNGTYYKDRAHTEPAEVGKDYWIENTRLGYYKIEESQKFDTRVDSDDMYNQYVAVFENTELDIEQATKQLPINAFNCFVISNQTSSIYTNLDEIKQLLDTNKNTNGDYFNYSINTTFKNIPVVLQESANTVRGVISLPEPDREGNIAYNVMITAPTNYLITPIDGNYQLAHCTSVDIPSNRWVGDNIYALSFKDVYKLEPMNVVFDCVVQAPRYIYHMFKYNDLENIRGGTRAYNFMYDIAQTPYDGTETIPLDGTDTSNCAVMILIDGVTEEVKLSGNVGAVRVTKLTENSTCNYQCTLKYDGQTVVTEVGEYLYKFGFIKADGSIPRTSPFYEYFGENGNLFMVEAPVSSVFESDAELGVTAKS